MKIVRCMKCLKSLDKKTEGNKVRWNPNGWLCYSCQKEWTELFFDKKLDKLLSTRARDEIVVNTVNEIWRDFIHFNPSVRYIFSE